MYSRISFFVRAGVWQIETCDAALIILGYYIVDGSLVF